MKKRSVLSICFIALVCLVVLPLIISAFAPRCNSEITADGLLGYIIQALSAVGTIALAAVAVWQNRKYKEDNDKAQERLERLTQQANEQYVIGKIIECESIRIAKIKSLIEDYTNHCNAIQIISLCIKVNHDQTFLSSDKYEWQAKALDLMNALVFELRNDPFVDSKEFQILISDLFFAAQTYIESLSQVSSANSDFSDSFHKTQSKYWAMRNDYLMKTDESFSQLVYGNMSLEEIREMYKPKHYSGRAKDEQENGKDET